MLARRDGISADSISIKTFDLPSDRTLTLGSKFEGIVGCRESVLGGFSAKHTHWAILYEIEPFLSSMIEIDSEPDSKFFDLDFGRAESFILPSPTPFFSNDSRILAVQLLGFDTVRPSRDFVVTFRAMPYPYDNPSKLQRSAFWTASSLFQTAIRFPISFAHGGSIPYAQTL